MSSRMASDAAPQTAKACGMSVGVFSTFIRAYSRLAQEIFFPPGYHRPK